ncbi:MAG TPA: hypothetical protein VNL91_05610 [Thermoanaerobaculia bacterium]|nr:hypothetical protein [Thermoanaerobaculia bacterium]
MSVARLTAVAGVVLSIAVAPMASAVCVNKFLRRSEGGNRQVVTLLTGKLTYQEAQALAQAISSNQAPGLEWVDEKGRTIARQFGDMKVVRPMPVSCDDKPSGVVVQATFIAAAPPIRKMSVKIKPDLTVQFEEQAE